MSQEVNPRWVMKVNPQWVMKMNSQWVVKMNSWWVMNMNPWWVVKVNPWWVVKIIPWWWWKWIPVTLVIIACEVGEKVSKPDIVRVQCRGVFEFLRLLPSVPFLLQVNTFKDNPSIYDLCASVFSNPQAYVMWDLGTALVCCCTYIQTSIIVLHEFQMAWVTSDPARSFHIFSKYCKYNTI